MIDRGLLPGRPKIFISKLDEDLAEVCDLYSQYGIVKSAKKRTFDDEHKIIFEALPESPETIEKSQPASRSSSITPPPTKIFKSQIDLSAMQQQSESADEDDDDDAETASLLEQMQKQKPEVTSTNNAASRCAFEETDKHEILATKLGIMHAIMLQRSESEDTLKADMSQLHVSMKLRTHNLQSIGSNILAAGHGSTTANNANTKAKLHAEFFKNITKQMQQFSQLEAIAVMGEIQLLLSNKLSKSIESREERATAMQQQPETKRIVSFYYLAMSLKKSANDKIFILSNMVHNTIPKG